MGNKAIRDPFESVRTAAAHLPGVEEGTSYGTPALKVRGKLIARLKDEQTLVLFCPLEEKEMLTSAEPSLYFETDHYKGWPAVLVRLDRIDRKELGHRLEQAWGLRAPKRLVASFKKSRGD